VRGEDVENINMPYVQERAVPLTKLEIIKHSLTTLCHD